MAGRVYRLGRVAFFLLLSCAGEASCQQEVTVPAPGLNPGAVITPTTMQREGLIHVDAVVTGEDDKFVRGLTEKDMLLLDNGVPGRILSVRSSKDTNDEDESLNEIVLVLDEVNLSSRQSFLAKRELIEFLQQRDGDLAYPVSIYRFSAGGLSATAVPTRDGKKLAGDLVHNRWPRNLWDIPQTRAGDTSEVVQRRYTLWSKALKAMFTLAVERRDKRGRKLVVWIGMGWPVKLAVQQDRENDFYLLEELSTRIREARMVICQISEWEDPQARGFAYTNYLEGVRSAAELGNSDLKHPFVRFALPVLATQSGGLVLDQSPDFLQALERCIDHASAFYTVSSDPPPTHEIDEYHDVEIRLPALHVKARTSTGYYNQPAFYDQPRVPSRSVSVQELEQELVNSGAERDEQLADELAGLELTERLSTGKLLQWKNRLRGQRSKEALTVLADYSVWHRPPSSELLTEPPPNHEHQVSMLKKSVQYLNAVLPALPNFFATRTVIEFDQRSPEQDTWKSGLEDQSLHETVTTRGTLLYRKGREEEHVDKRRSRSGVRKNLHFYGIFGPILQSVLRDATALGNGLTWDRWERGERGKEAVFDYDVRTLTPSYVVATCCRRNGQTFQINPQYHGELAIDPESGAILRLTMESRPGWFVEPDLAPVQLVKTARMILEYGPVTFGGRQYMCPQRSVVMVRSRAVKPLKLMDEDFAVYAPYETMMDDATYTSYHKFGSESRILPGFEEMQGQDAPQN